MFITISSLILVASPTNSSLDNSEGFIGLPNTTLTLQGLNLLSSSNPLLAPSIVTGTINALALVANLRLPFLNSPTRPLFPLVP